MTEPESHTTCSRPGLIEDDSTALTTSELTPRGIGRLTRFMSFSTPSTRFPSFSFMKHAKHLSAPAGTGLPLTIFAIGALHTTHFLSPCGAPPLRGT
jgi:hypothetical protein